MAVDRFVGRAKRGSYLNGGRYRISFKNILLCANKDHLLEMN